MINAFCKWLLKQVENHSIYIWGGQGERTTRLTLDDIKRMENSEENYRRVVAFINSLVARGVDLSKSLAFDCSGLGTTWLIENGLLKYDTTADGLYRKCTKKPITDIKKGDWVFKVSNGKATHIGYVVDNNKTIVEAFGRDFGVVKNELYKGSSRFTEAGTFNG